MTKFFNHDQASKISKSIIIMLFSLGLASCGGGSGGDSGGDSGNGNSSDLTSLELSELLSNVADIAYQGYIDLDTSSNILKTKISEYCADNTNSAKRIAAQNAFKDAMDDLQKAVIYAAKNQGLEPGLDVEKGMEVIYSWPLTNTCKVDKDLASNTYTLSSAQNARGMDIVEYLLFVDTDGNSSCDPNKLDNNDKAFNELSPSEKTARRCQYMDSLMTDITKNTKFIKDTWDPDIGNYLGTLKASSNPVVSLNLVTDGMYYIADVGKEDKLAQPMGSGRANTTPSCGSGNACPEDVESVYARISLDNLISNVTSFQKLYYGGDPAKKASNIGFDDWLIARGEEATATATATNIDDVLNGLNSLKTNKGTLYDAVANDTDKELENFFDGPYQSLTRGFRDDVLPKLGLRPPQSSLADTD